MSSQNQEKILEQLALMGFSSPEWDSYHINKPPPPTLSTNIKPVEMSKKQLFLVKTWPKISSFFHEDEDPVVISNAETLSKNGQLTRVFRIAFDNETQSQRWQFVLEKRIDTGMEELSEKDIRQIWAKSLPDPLPLVTEKCFYSRSFDTQASSSKFKTNCETGIVANFQKAFLREIKSILVETYQSTEAVSQEVEDENQDNSYYKGKEFQFQENGFHITWTVSIRQVDINELPAGTYFVDAVEVSTPPVQPEEENEKIVESKSMNPFESASEENDDLKSDEDRQIMEDKILEFIGQIWPKVRNFYLELSDDDENISFNTSIVRKNGLPTRILELHFDTLNERNRWKFVFEVSVASSAFPDRKWALINPGKTENYFETRTYDSFEKRGTTSMNSDVEEKNAVFNGFYKRWFLSEVQWKLVKCFAQVGFFSVNQQEFDPHHFAFGKDLEFPDGRDHVTWSFSVQKLAKYPYEEAPSNVWCFGISDSFLPPVQTVPSIEEGDAEESDASHEETPEVPETKTDESTHEMKQGKTELTKSKSRIKTLARNIVKPVMEKTSWFKTSGIFRTAKGGKGGSKHGVKDRKSSVDDSNILANKDTTKNSGKSNSLKREQTLSSS